MTDGTVATRGPRRARTTRPVRPGDRSDTHPRRSDPGAAPAAGGFFPVIRRWAVVIAVATGIALLVGYGLASRATPTYEARAGLLVGPLNADIATVRAATAATGTYVQLAGAPTTIERVARTTGVDRDLLYTGVRVTADPEARILTVRARAHTAEDAAAVANGIGLRLIRLAADDSPEPAGLLRMVDQASEPSSPISPRIAVIAPLAAVAGLLGGLALVMVLELLGDAAGSVGEVRRAAGAPALSVPAGRGGAAGARSGEMVAAHLDLVRPGCRSVMLCGTSGPDGGGRLALELAGAWAATGGRVVVVDAGAGETTTVMGLGERAGVDEALAGAEVAPVRLGGGVEALGGRRTRRGEVVDLGAVVRVVDELVATGARVVVHAPPVTAAPAGLAWGRAVDTTVLVARRDAGRRGPIAEAAAALRRVDADLAFTVLHPGGRPVPHLAVTPARILPTRARHEAVPA